jgi:L-lysine exporter family protein LysE/ArgO
MPPSSSLILSGMVLGLGAAVPIGPVNVEIARRTLRLGPRFGFALGCGAVTIDVIFAIAASLGVAPLMQVEAIRRGLTGVGVCVLVFLAFLSFRSAWRAIRSTDTATTAAAAGDMSENVEPAGQARDNVAGGVAGSYAAGFAMTASNPYTWLFWFSVVPGMSGGMAVNPRHDLPMICVGVFVAAFTWVLFFVGVLSVLRLFAGRTWYIVTDIVGGTMLLGFGFWALWR